MNVALELTISLAERVSVAFHQNAIPIASEIVISNRSEQELAEVEIRLRSEPGFFVPAVWRIERIVAGGVHHIALPDLRLEPGILAKLTEMIRGQITLTAMIGEAELACHRSDVELLPPSHWGGVTAAPELLAAFVRPNDSAVDLILRDAAAALAEAGKATAIDGYNSKLKARAYEIAEAIWIALARRGITYVLPPASFERSGQKVRSPSDIVDRRVATCLDLGLLYAACAEQAGLNPILILVAGHAFVGLWLKDEDFSSAILEDVQVLRKRRSLDDLILIETTLLTAQPPARFTAAVTAGAEHLTENAKSPFELAVDIRRARARQIRPLDLGGHGLADLSPSTALLLPQLGFGEIPSLAEEIVVAEEASDERLGRLETWKRRLLDLTLRNKLLNFKDAKKAIAVECPDPARLEDLLSSGKLFKLLARTDVLGENDQRSAQLFADRHHDDGRRRYVLEALDRGDLHTRVAEKELDARLTELFRLARTSFEEGGANILFLALGFLRWTQKERGQSCRAPLLLVPVSLQRSSVRSGFRLALHEDEARFNPTLLELLRQDFQLRVPELEGELPTDASGLDVARIWRIVRTHVRDLQGWEVDEDVVLSTFSFTKYLMWKDLHDRTELLKRNPVVRHLIDTPKNSYGDGTGFPDPGRLDADYRPADIFAPLSADSSQLAAVLAAQAGKDFVLFGPPGTGKSQTIANIIAQCLAHRRTVLFVSQKTAALEVVRRRLREIGLGDYCLEVHSTKAQKSEVLGQLKAAWYDRKVPTADEWTRATDELEELRDELNGLVTALHRRRGNGLSAYEAFGRVVAHGDRYAGIRLDWPDDSDHSAATLDALRRSCRELNTAMQAVGDVAAHPLAGIEAAAWSPMWRNEMQTAIEELVAHLPALESAASRFTTVTFGTDVIGDHRAFRSIVMLAAHLTKPEARGAHAFLTEQGGALRHAIAELRSMQEVALAKRRRLAGRYRNAIFEQDPRRLLQEWTAATNANFILRGGRQKSVRAQLQVFADGPVPADPAGDLAILVELAELDKEARRLGPAFARFGIPWQGLDTSVERLDALVAWAFDTRRICDRAAAMAGLDPSALCGRVVSLLTESPESLELGGKIRAACDNLHAPASLAFAAIERLGRLAGIDDPSQPPASGPSWIQASVETALRWKAHLHQAPAWANWTSAVAKAREAGLASLVASLECGELDRDELDQAFELAYARWWIDRVVTDDPALRGFIAARHEDNIARFKAADARVGEIAKQIVRARLGGDVPSPTTFGSDPEWGTLARELTKKARHMPLRKLFAQIPTALTRLTPCVMMSPLSIAQFLPADAQPFDVVLFDEASQIPVWDAIGVIARGKQVVVVGDPQQLPPTSFGERGVDEVEDGTDVTDQESILDECLAANIPSRRLDWHYRSRHESLIAFSNHAYYTGQLVTFPSPVTEDRAVRYVHVPGGVYERGTGRVNREEARAVTADVVQRLKAPGFVADRRSIGIVTFNGEQQRLIENLLDQERRNNPELERFFDPARWHEPVFVKNLENVQGDERDAILFSIAVGPDETGRISATVSSLNRDGGHRRLNVAITRARRELVVFATLRPEQVDLSRTNARGVRDFKHFLEYAERGAKAIAEAFAPTGRATESPFEDAVKAALEGKGWVVHPQVGVSAFRVDLGIVHPDAPGRYLAGVECDGATYHRSATARDRDRLRELVLTDLGWTIRRVWSTDWWHDAGSALDKLHRCLTADCEESQRRVQDGTPTPDITTDARVVDEDTSSNLVGRGDDSDQSEDEHSTLLLPPVEPRAPVYADMPTPIAPAAHGAGPIYSVANLSDCGLVLEADRFYDPLYRSTLRALVAHIIRIEGPIFEDVVIRRVARAHGFARTGDKIRAAVLKAVDSRFPRSEESDRPIYWPEASNPHGLSVFRRSLAAERDHGDVPLTELASLARRYLDDGADHDETLRLMAQDFQLGKLRETTRIRLLSAIALATRDPI
jgi:very-short-patch-repair endonuclease